MEAKKIKLDQMLDAYKAQPVGSGYIDIIVKRDNYKEFVKALLSEGFVIKAISWWEYISPIDSPIYGMGGPKSRYYDGWFAEINADVDEVAPKKPTEEAGEEILKMVENKVLHFYKDTISFRDYELLTPAFWLDVPEGWQNTLSGEAVL